ncbi:hypothetical protein [Allobaculum sp. JKK-2023]|uniref:hypothetical protein n=1 Tax=Allobaculum sp. JKK-2023 TaxID=3108943 RepID=UPI002B05687A|nr:hypothetical protein [Allobaculum sp. JKK-2023]
MTVEYHSGQSNFYAFFRDENAFYLRNIRYDKKQGCQASYKASFASDKTTRKKIGEKAFSEFVNLFTKRAGEV